MNDSEGPTRTYFSEDKSRFSAFVNPRHRRINSAFVGRFHVSDLIEEDLLEERKDEEMFVTRSRPPSRFEVSEIPLMFEREAVSKSAEETLPVMSRPSSELVSIRSSALPDAMDVTASSSGEVPLERDVVSIATALLDKVQHLSEEVCALRRENHELKQVLQTLVHRKST